MRFAELYQTMLFMSFKSSVMRIISHTNLHLRRPYPTLKIQYKHVPVSDTE